MSSQHAHRLARRAGAYDEHDPAQTPKQTLIPSLRSRRALGRRDQNKTLSDSSLMSALAKTPKSARASSPVKFLSSLYEISSQPETPRRESIVTLKGFAPAAESTTPDKWQIFELEGQILELQHKAARRQAEFEELQIQHSALRSDYLSLRSVTVRRARQVKETQDSVVDARRKIAEYEKFIDMMLGLNLAGRTRALRKEGTEGKTKGETAEAAVVDAVSDAASVPGSLWEKIVADAISRTLVQNQVDPSEDIFDDLDMTSSSVRTGCHFAFNQGILQGLDSSPHSQARNPREAFSHSDGSADATSLLEVDAMGRF